MVRYDEKKAKQEKKNIEKPYVHPPSPPTLSTAIHPSTPPRFNSMSCILHQSPPSLPNPATRQIGALKCIRPHKYISISHRFIVTLRECFFYVYHSTWF